MIINKEHYCKVIEDSRKLEKLGKKLNAKIFPSISKNIKLRSLRIPIEIIEEEKEEIRGPGNTCKILPNTYKPLPSVGHTSYHKHRNSMKLSEIDAKIEMINQSKLWRQQTVIPPSYFRNLEKKERTRIVTAESLFGGRSQPKFQKTNQATGTDRNQIYERIFLKIQKKSEIKAEKIKNKSLESQESYISFDV